MQFAVGAIIGALPTPDCRVTEQETLHCIQLHHTNSSDEVVVVPAPSAPDALHEAADWTTQHGHESTTRSSRQESARCPTAHLTRSEPLATCTHQMSVSIGTSTGMRQMYSNNIALLGGLAGFVLLLLVLAREVVSMG